MNCGMQSGNLGQFDDLQVVCFLLFFLPMTLQAGHLSFDMRLPFVGWPTQQREQVSLEVWKMNLGK